MRDHPVIKKRSRFCPLADGGNAVRIEGKAGQKPHPLPHPDPVDRDCRSTGRRHRTRFAPPRQRVPQP